VAILSREYCWRCLPLVHVQIEPSSRLLRIEDWEFGKCGHLHSCYIPDHLEFDDVLAFFATYIVDIQVAVGNRHFRTSGSFLLDFSGTSLVRYFGKGQTMTIPNCVEELRPRCCAVSRAITEIHFEFPSRVRRIDKRAFNLSPKLVQICIPSSVERIGRACFCSCPYLRDVTFECESRLQVIKKRVFECCPSLPAICIPSSVEVMREACFRDCHGLSVVAFECDSRLKRLPRDTFYGCSSLTAICIPSSVKVIGKYCFLDCKKLCDVAFAAESHLAKIEDSAFDSCSSLTSMRIPASVRTLNVWCVSRCPSALQLTFESGSRVGRARQWLFASRRGSRFRRLLESDDSGWHPCYGVADVVRALMLLIVLPLACALLIKFLFG
jgi:hypothetical protein